MKSIFYKSKSCLFQAVWIQCLHPKKMPTQIILDLTRILIQLQPCLGQHSLRKHEKTKISFGLPWSVQLANYVTFYNIYHCALSVLLVLPVTIVLVSRGKARWEIRAQSSMLPKSCYCAQRDCLSHFSI